MSKEYAQAHLDEPAVLCCRREAGTVISEADLEDPAVLADLEDSGLLAIPQGSLSIGAVLGKTLYVDAEALTAISAAMLKEGAAPAGVETKAKALNREAQKEGRTTSGMITIHVDRLEGLDISLPGDLPFFRAHLPYKEPAQPPAAPPVTKRQESRIVRSLTHKFYTVKRVEIGGKTSLSSGVLTIDSSLPQAALTALPLVKKVEMDVITPEQRHVYTNTIMDVMPVAVKRTGKIGEGETAVLDGVVFCLTGKDENDVQVHEFGSSEGCLDEKIAFGRPGAPDESDIIVRVNVIVEANTGMERRGPLAAHTACDFIIQSIRDVIRETAEPASSEAVHNDIRRPSLPRVALVKEIMGQGAMHDNILLPNEPAGVTGGQKNVDLGNVPVMLSANEVRDGGIHALTCIGPATKETTRHYFREPLVHTLATDDEIDLVGVIFVGSPQVNDEKMYVSDRLGAWIEAMDLDGAIVTTEGFGNNHIDFAGHIAAIGSRGVPVVGVTFSAYQGQLVAGNEYMDAMIELN
ncbi:MAG: D-proline reductase (dithiol) proprotein PrdA, partial [Spirochaetaceae bacterium]|nr:D-proline reductase (dithiol) proprotein PrdA [Spirochaetaceae bacterium]